ncbi:MAG: hypothetical protein ACRERD_10810 [Candidatus Binatia bacterium]
MNKTIHTMTWSLCLLGGLVVAAPTLVGAVDDQAHEQGQMEATQETRDMRQEARPMDQETHTLERTPATQGMGTQNWAQGQAQLQQALQPGQAADTYRQQLEQMGYRITSTNYDDDDYLEYEVVKGNQTYEVQIDVDKDNREATAIDIAQNIWKTDATERALARYARTGRGDRNDADDRDDYAPRRGYQYSERDRSMTDQMVRELEALPVGRDKKFYKEELKNRGYTITKINTDDRDKLEIETVKDNRSLALNVDFDEDTGRSTEVEASGLWWESEATQRTRDKDMRGAADRDEAWEQGQAQLQKALKPGQPAGAYRQKLEEMGYMITSVNYNNDDYLEYEIVKDNQTYEVQIDVSDDTRKATEIDIAQNIWKTDATERALFQTDGDGRDDYMMTRGYQYSDRDRSMTDEMVKEMEALPVGRDKQFYKQELKKRGYEITKVNTDDQDELELEAVKNSRSLALNVDFDEDSGRSTEVDASTLWWESEATQRARTEGGRTTIERTAREERSEQRRMQHREHDGERGAETRPMDAERMSEADRAQVSREAE